MRSIGRFISVSLVIWVICAVAFVSRAGAQDVAVLVSLDRDTIGLDEQAMLEVEINSTEQDLPEPRMPTLSMFEVYSQGRSSSISVVNGQVSSTVIYRYVLLPTRSGTFPIDRIAVVHRGRRYQGNRVELTVLDQGTATPPDLEEQARDDEGDARDYFLEAVVDKRNPYVNEQVTLTLKFFIAVQYYGSPELTEPTTTGFWAELLGNKAPYYQRINGRNYRVIERKYALFPTQTGELTIGRAMITTTVASKKRRYRDPFDVFGDVFGRGEEVIIRSSPVKITARPLPTEGRPSDYTGTIGSFSISAAANKTSVEVNQPISLTIKISGTGNIKSVGEPVIPELDEFRIYRASSSENISKLNDRLGGTKVYEEVFIPKRPGELTIPALSYNYFDPGRGEYRTISTAAITIDVTKPEGYVPSPDVPYAAPEFTIGSQARDIRYIKDDVGDATPVGSLILLTPLYMIVNGVPVVLLAGAVLLRKRREKLARDVGYARSRGASRIARKRLAKARSMAETETAGEFYAEVYSALVSFIADRMNISPHGLTGDRIKQLLMGTSVDDTFIEQSMALMQKCDFARYAPSSISQDDIDSALSEAEEVMVILEGLRFDG
ncbi:MAG: protein BatD [Candidatus Zixiibacteriota bacterium]|nr:MAG: protein BatD [candidate division Zixibacteria bacterium]